MTIGRNEFARITTLQGVPVLAATGSFRDSSIAGHILVDYVRQCSQFLKLISDASLWSVHESQIFPSVYECSHTAP